MYTKESESELIRVRAPSYREALEKISREYGSQVSVVRTRVVRKAGIAGMVGGRAVEVLLSPARRPTLGAPESVVSKGDVAQRAETISERVSTTVQRLVEAREAYERERAQSHGKPSSPVGVEDESPAVESPPSTADRTRDEEVATLRSDHSRGVRELSRLVIERGFSSETCSSLIREATARHEASDAALDVRRTLESLVRARLPECRPISLTDGSTSTKAIACVGPTGVGKTTTLAKLAAPLSLIHRKKVAIVALDTFRIGATEQVRRYGDIMGIDVIVADDLDDLEREAEGLLEYDAVFIDTPGTNQRQVGLWEEIRRKIHFFQGAEIHLCLPANGALDFALECVERLRPVRYDRVLFTKVDEAVRFGHLVDVWERARVPVSYFTCGQNVPDDIRAATPESLESLVWGEYA